MYRYRLLLCNLLVEILDLKSGSGALLAFGLEVRGRHRAGGAVHKPQQSEPGAAPHPPTEAAFYLAEAVVEAGILAPRQLEPLLPGWFSDSGSPAPGLDCHEAPSRNPPG